ncbi:MAG: hypothetical protein Q7R49_01220 [Candidatus Daviesbacteria bacterium]|nr:hypothetical protein [Candidatus Daviesbacteria bacterium]
MRIHGVDSISSYYLKIESYIRSEIQSKDDNYILEVDEDEYAEFLYQEHSLEPILKDDSREQTIEEISSWTDEQGILGPYTKEHLGVKLEYPIQVNRTTDEVDRLQSSVLGSFYNWELNEATGIYKTFLDQDPSAIKGALNSLETVLLNKNSQIESFNPQLREKIKTIIRERIEKVKQNKSNFEDLIKTVGVPLKVVNKDAVKPINFGVKPQIKILIPPTAKTKTDYVLDKEKVLTVLQIIDNLVSSWESAPNSYNDRPEEELRDIILSSLNSVFAGKATAETFSKKGKADIFLNIERGEILIMECKWWDGEKTLSEAVDQILGYITWRHSYGIIIIFSKNQDFTAVLKSAKQTIENHKSYKDNIKSITDSHFESQHVFPEDIEKNIELHVVVYSLCKPK